MSAATVPSSDTERAEAVSAAYVDVGLPEEVSKQYNQTLNFKSWGVLARGGLGCVSCPPEVRSQIFWLLTLPDCFNVYFDARVSKHRGEIPGH